MRDIKRRSECPISLALDFLGDKWSLLIIRDMMFRGKSTFGEFLKSDEKIATNILADRLAVLERECIITKAAHPEKGNQFVYKLTPQGIDLMPVLFELVLWGDKYMTISEKGQNLAEKIRQDKEELIRKLTENLQ